MIKQILYAVWCDFQQIYPIIINTENVKESTLEKVIHFIETTINPFAVRRKWTDCATFASKNKS